MKEKTALANGEDKHIKLHNSIMRTNTITDRLDDLIRRIEGPVDSDTSTTSRGDDTPSFIRVLEGGPGVLDEIVDNANSRINQLQSLLF